MSSISSVRRRRWAWFGMLAAVIAVLTVALSPPLLSPPWRSAVMHVFSPVCHQIPVRSPVLGDVQIAICDRCTGIYLGLVLGVATVGWGRRIWWALGRHDRYLLLGSLVPAGIDWLGPILGLWSNGPVSRALTGLVFGIVAASFVADRVLVRFRRNGEAATPTGAEDRGFA